MTKSRFRIVIGLIVFTLVLSAAYYTGYKLYQKNYGEKEKAEYEKASKKKTVAVDAGNENKITNKTKFTLEYYDASDYSLKEEQRNMPAEYIGLTREELIKKISAYEESPSIEDLEAGFKSFELVSFSQDKIVLRKTYEEEKKNDKYYFMEEDGYITVYYIDKSTVFEYTDIQMDMLPENIQQQIREGEYKTDIHGLYDFLENYSS